MLHVSNVELHFPFQLRQNSGSPVQLSRLNMQSGMASFALNLENYYNAQERCKLLKDTGEKNKKAINDKQFSKDINFPLQALISSKSKNLITSQYINTN